MKAKKLFKYKIIISDDRGPTHFAKIRSSQKLKHKY